MPSYDFECKKCEHIWEEFLSITAPTPEECPKCNLKEEGNITRLISGGSGRGIVELTGQELVQKTKDDARKFEKELYSSEKQYAATIGENRYQEIQSRMDRQRR